MKVLAWFWTEIRGNLMWAWLCWIFGGGVLAALAQALNAIMKIPFQWKFSAIVFVISSLCLAVITLLARPRTRPQQTEQSQLATNQPDHLSDQMIAVHNGMDKTIIAEYDKLFVDAANRLPSDRDRETFLIQGMAVLLI
jgi:hypothetical protein